MAGKRDDSNDDDDYDDGSDIDLNLILSFFFLF